LILIIGENHPELMYFGKAKTKNDFAILSPNTTWLWPTSIEDGEITSLISTNCGSIIVSLVLRFCGNNLESQFAITFFIRLALSIDVHGKFWIIPHLGFFGVV